MAKEGVIAIAGWLKLYREIIKKPIWKQSTPEQKAILITLLCMVNHEEMEWEWQGKKYICMPGQVITSLDKIAKEAGKGISIQNVRTALLRFEKLGFLTNQSTKESRLITINNWELYQSQEVELTKNLTDGSQRGNKGVTTNKNDKNDKNDKEIYNKSPLEITLDDFKEFRKKIKKPLTPKAEQLLLSKLNNLASDDTTKIAILEQSILNGWQGVFPLKEDRQQQQPVKETAYERAKREAFEMLKKEGLFDETG